MDKKIEIKIFNQRSLGPEPSTWTHTTKKAFINHFDRRSEPLNEVDKEAEPPLVQLESTGVGFAWMFSGIGADEPTLVKAVVDAPVRSTVLAAGQRRRLCRSTCADGVAGHDEEHDKPGFSSGFATTLQVYL